MEITGTIKAIFDIQVVSERFKKRDFVVTIDETTPYPQHLLFQIVQDKVNVLDTIQEGNEVKVQFNLKGREWTNPQGEVKYFNTIDAWRIEIINAKPVQQQRQAQQSNDISHVDDGSDLPF